MQTDTNPEPGGECDVSFFIACFNEELNIVSTIETVLKASREVGCTFDIVIIDDASTDKSPAVIQEYMARHPELPIKLLVNPRNQGFGVNYAEGCFHGRGKYYRVICGDDEERLESLIAALRQMGKADIVTSYMEDATARSFSRRLVSNTYTTLVNLISGHKLHYYNGLPIVPRKVAMRWHSQAHGFGFQADLIVRLLDMGATYIEVPVVAKNRVAGATKAFTFRNMASVGHTLLEIFIRRAAMVMFPRYTSQISMQRTVVQTEAYERGETVGCGDSNSTTPTP